MHTWTRIATIIALSLSAGICRGEDPMGSEKQRADSTGSTIELTLPPVIYAYPGLETNVYFENTVLMINPENVVFDVTCSRGMQLHERWTFTPSPDDVGDHSLTLSVIGQDNQVIDSASAVVRVANPEAGGDFSILMIGDSLTHASIYPARIAELADSDNALALRLVGTHAPRKDEPALRHEGYGGWTAVAFTSRYAETDWKDGRRARSPFVFAGDTGDPVFDFQRYCREENGGNVPDVVTILLGCNDTFGATEDRQAEAIQKSLDNVDILIEGIKGADADTRIGILLLAPPAGTQDAFGANYRCGQTRWQYRRNQHRYVRRTIETYGNREDDGIYLLPVSVVVDPHGGFPSRAAAINAHSDETVVRLVNGVHPSAVGYRQIGDTVFGWLKSVVKQ